MGYLTVQGNLLTYNEYKDRVDSYKMHGLKEFLKIYEAHKNKFRTQKDLHWGEEIEYTLFYFDAATQKVQLSNQGFKLLQEFNEMHKDEEVHLHPEFGNWMVEAVPAHPYNAIEDLKELLTCFTKITKR